MLYILGIGAAAPQTTITNELLHELNPKLHTFSGGPINERRSIVDLDILRAQKGGSSKETLLNAKCSPTELGAEAARNALAASGITAESLGLVVGDCSTPVQTCPSEGQRVAGKLGVKVPSYDILGSTGAFLIHLDTIRRWKEEKISEYILGLTCHTPTHAIDYANSTAGYFFGDGAAAYVFSVKHKAGYRVIDSDYTIDAKASSLALIEAQGHLRFPESFISDHMLPSVERSLAHLKDVYGSQFSKSYFIGPQLDKRLSTDLAIGAGFSSDKILTNNGKNGDCLGASAPTILAETWNTVKPGSMVFIVQSGIGLDGGFAVLERVG